MRRTGPILGLVMAFCLASTAWAAAPDAWSSLQFLLGDWDAVAKPGEPAGWSSFSSELGGRIIVRRNHAEYPASKGRPAAVHDDLLIIYREGDPAAIRAIYFDSESHVIRYIVESATERRVVLVTEPAANAPRFRLSYALMPDARLGGTFEIAPPGKPEDFATHLEWVARKRPASQAATPQRDDQRGQ